MITVRDMIRGSMRLIGVLAAGETPTAQEQQDAILSLKGMLDSWSTDGFAVQYRQREEFPLVQGTASYTIGSGGDFDTVRPIEILKAKILEVSPSPSFESDLEILNTSEYADIGAKDTQGIPSKIYRFGGYPLDTLTFYPAPDVGRKVVLYSRKKLIDIVNANTEIDLPEGYERAIRYNLAIELAPEYGRSVSQEVATIATDSKAAIMRMNGGPQYLEVGAILAGVNYFNIYTGE